MTGGLEGRVALVSGVARGIGLATARALAGAGARIAGLDLPGEPMEAACGALPGLLPLAGNVADSGDWARAVAAVDARFGRLDILVNNAGISGPISLMADYPEEDFDAVMAVNARGVFLGMKACVPLLKAAGKGAIINISSISGLGGGRYTLAYTASKHAVVGMTKLAAMELAPDGIRVNAVCPAPTDTEMMHSLERRQRPDDPLGFRRDFSTMIPLGRYGTPEEVAALVVFLAGDGAGFMTGAAIPVDGGMRAR